MGLPSKDVKPGQAVELGRYEVGDEKRHLIGQRIAGVVHIYDCPLGRRGRKHFVERGFRSCDELAVLVADYKGQAERLGACPMTRAALDALFEIAEST